MERYIKVSVIVPFMVNVFLGIILSITHDGSSYKSEWFTDDGFILTVFLTIFLSGFISILSLLFLLNRNDCIRNNFFFSFTSWILLPGSVCLFVIYEEILNFSGASDIDGYYPGNRMMDGYILFVGVVHLFFLFFSFINFRKNIMNSI